MLLANVAKLCCSVQVVASTNTSTNSDGGNSGMITSNCGMEGNDVTWCGVVK